MVTLPVLMNANTKYSQMKYSPYPKYGMIYSPDMDNLQIGQKKHLKNDQELKFTFHNMSLLNKLQYQHCFKIYNGPKIVGLK